MTKFYGLYRGVVVSNADPEKRGRLLLQVPQVFGFATTNWALPCWPAGWNRSLMHDHVFVDNDTGYQSSGSTTEVLRHKLLLAVPGPGSSVWVTFEGGESTSPVWIGMGTNTQIADALLGSDSTAGGGAAGDGSASGDGSLGPSADSLPPDGGGGGTATHEHVYPVVSVNGLTGSVTLTTTEVLGNTAWSRITGAPAFAITSGAQTFAGTQTFSAAPAVPDNSWTLAKTSGLQAALDAKYSASNPPPAPDLSAYATTASLSSYATTTALTNGLATKLGVSAKAADADLLDGYNADSGATALTIALRDGSGRVSVATPTSAAHAATKGYVDGAFLPLAGKAADAELLDGLDSLAFLRKGFAGTTGATAVNTLNVNSLNQALASGWYDTSGGTGAPDGNWWLVQVITHSSGAHWQRQIAHSMTGETATQSVYSRRCNGGDPTLAGSWSSWVRIDAAAAPQEWALIEDKVLTQVASNTPANCSFTIASNWKRLRLVTKNAKTITTTAGDLEFRLSTASASGLYGETVRSFSPVNNGYTKIDVSATNQGRMVYSVFKGSGAAVRTHARLLVDLDSDTGYPAYEAFSQHFTGSTNAPTVSETWGQFGSTTRPTVLELFTGNATSWAAGSRFTLYGSEQS
jgi:hypothetical protein